MNCRMFIRKYLFVFVSIAVGIRCANCEYYTSVQSLYKLLQIEEELLNILSQHELSTEHPDSQKFLESFGIIKNEFAEAKKDPDDYVTNPINAFKLIKRFLFEWTHVELYIKEHSIDAYDEFYEFLDKKPRSDLPNEEDLAGAANGLALLQETYGLEPAELAEGRIYGKTYSSPMSMSDSLSVGLSLYRAGIYTRSLPWFLISLDKMKSSPTTTPEAKTVLMRYLSVAYFKIGNPKMALLLTNEILAIEPENREVLANKKLYTKKLLEERESKKKDQQSPIETETMALSDHSMRLCRGDDQQSPSRQRALRCMYTSNGIPYRLIQPFKVEQINLDPLILYYHTALTDTQIKEAIDEASQNLKRSTISKKHITTSGRTSQQNWLYYNKHKYPSTIAPLLKHITGLSFVYAEPIQVANYGIGGYYVPHHDFLEEAPKNKIFIEGGNRIATALAYLSSVDMGGATAFTYLNVTVKPEKGSVLFWCNMHESLEYDYRTEHLACPVLKGTKWILTQWLHERDQIFTRPCSLERQGFLSDFLTAT